jgi:hypothetical protein
MKLSYSKAFTKVIDACQSLVGRIKLNSFEMDKSKYRFIKVLVISYVFSHVVFFALNNRFLTGSYFLAPDEEGYVEMFRRAQSDELNICWGFPCHTSRAELLVLYLPATLFKLLGLSDLSATRLQSSLFVLISYLLLAFTLERINRLFRFVIPLTIFIPTFFIWSSLALRESFIYLSLALVIFGIASIRKGKKWTGFIALYAGLFMISSVKEYLFIVITVSIIIMGFYFILIRKKCLESLTFHLLSIVLVLLSNVGLFSSINSQVKSVISGQTIASSVLNQNSVTPDSANTTSKRLQELNEKQEKSQLLDVVNKVILEKSSAVPESGAVPESSMQPQEPINNLSLKAVSWLDFKGVFLAGMNIIWHPSIFLDYPSRTLEVVSLETPIWTVLIIGSILAGILGLFKKDLSMEQVFSLVFVLIYLYTMTLYTINVGTMVRHRSNFLIPTLVVLAQVLPHRSSRKT